MNHTCFSTISYCYFKYLLWQHFLSIHFRIIARKDNDLFIATEFVLWINLFFYLATIMLQYRTPLDHLLKSKRREGDKDKRKLDQGCLVFWLENYTSPWWLCQWEWWWKIVSDSLNSKSDALYQDYRNCS